MNRLEKWFLKRLCKKLVKQGPHHQSNIIDYYNVIYRVARKEFYEDSELALLSFMLENFVESSKVDSVTINVNNEV